MKPILQTDTFLEINTSQLRLSIPGQWESRKPKSPQTLFSGQAKDRHIIVDGHLLEDGLSSADRLEAVGDLLRVYIDVETKMTEGESKVFPQEPVTHGTMTIAGYICMHPDAGRVVFFRILCDHEKAFGIYWEASGFVEAPDINKLSEEFLLIVESARLK